jgi:hypothetical protein
MNDHVDPTQPPETQALMDAIGAVLGPLARLAVARGVRFSDLEERMKQAFVQAARDAHPGGLPHRQVSRISITTGINRREVTRLVKTANEPTAQQLSLAMRAYFRWSTDPDFQDADGQALALKRQGESGSFEAMASRVTRDVHPRSLLEDMVRLKIAVWDAEADIVTLSNDAFVPNDDVAHLLEFLGANVGDHLRAAVENVSGVQPRHFEQSIRGTGMATASMHSMRPLLEQQWKAMTRKLVPELQRRIDADGQAGPEPAGEVRIGLYMYSHTPTQTASDQGQEPHEDA